MPRLGIALDLGTSGFRGQAIDLDQGGKIISTAITTRHPLPGANVMDHLHFALEVGVSYAHDVVVMAVNDVINNLNVHRNQVERVAVCGNPIQLSLFQNIEIRDLAYAGKRKLDALGVIPPNRDSRIVKAPEISGLDIPSTAVVLIPPAVRHEIGADALAMLIQTGILESDTIAIVTDYGTNNEMALVAGGAVYTGSTAAGPALEGQHIEDGLLALPGAIADIEFVDSYSELILPGYRRMDSQHIKVYVLNEDMRLVTGDTVDSATGSLIEKGKMAALGITGTGVVALICEGLKSRLIRIPQITTQDRMLHLPDGLRFTEKDLAEAGKAIGAVRAGHITLCHEAGIRLEDIQIAYCSGASGTYVDALKAQQIGMIPSGVKQIFQVGNTSLSMARDLVRDENELWRMKDIASKLRQNHCMFAESKVFEKIYILEIAYWTEGMPMTQYQKFLKKYGFPALNQVVAPPQVIRTVERDIQDLGEKGLRIIDDIGEHRRAVFLNCLCDMACINECPEKALYLETHDQGAVISINLALCDGVACRRCERACKDKVFDLIALITSSDRP